MFNFFNKIVQTLEKNRLSIVGMCIVIFSILFIRSHVEDRLFLCSWGVIDYAYVMAFYFVYIIGIMFIVRVFSKTSARKTANALIFVLWIIILAPIVDKFIFHESVGYSYLQSQDLLFPFSNMKPGQIILILTLIYLILVYVFIKTKSFSRAILSGGCAYVFGLVMGTLFFSWGFPPYYNLFLFYFIITAVFLTLLMYANDKRMFVGLLKSVKLRVVVVFAALVFLGASWGGGLNWLIHPLSRDFARVFLGAAAIVLAWIYAAAVNDIYDIKIDRVSHKGGGRALVSGVMSAKQMWNFAILCAAASLLTSLTLGAYHFAIALGCILLGTIYSIPPLRLRRSLLALCIIGAGALLASIMGFMIFKTTIFAPENVLAGGLVFFAASTGPVAKDLEDYEGDKSTGVRTVFTVFGLEKGLRITQLLLSIAFLLPLVLFNSPIDIVAFPSLAAVVVLLFGKIKKFNIVLVLYLVLFVYCVCRITGVVG